MHLPTGLCFPANLSISTSPGNRGFPSLTPPPTLLALALSAQTPSIPSSFVQNLFRLFPLAPSHACTQVCRHTHTHTHAHFETHLPSVLLHVHMFKEQFPGRLLLFLRPETSASRSGIRYPATPRDHGVRPGEQRPGSEVAGPPALPARDLGQVTGPPSLPHQERTEPRTRLPGGANTTRVHVLRLLGPRP